MLFTFRGRLFPNRDPSAYTRAEINRRPAHQQRQCRELNPKIDSLTCIRKMKLYENIGTLWAVNFGAALSNDDCIILY